MILSIFSGMPQVFADTNFENENKAILQEVLLNKLKSLQGKVFNHSEVIDEGHEFRNYAGYLQYTRDYYHANLRRELKFDSLDNSRLGPLQGTVIKTGSQAYVDPTFGYTTESVNQYIKVVLTIVISSTPDQRGLWNGYIALTTERGNNISEGTVDFEATGSITFNFDDGDEQFYKKRSY